MILGCGNSNNNLKTEASSMESNTVPRSSSEDDGRNVAQVRQRLTQEEISKMKNTGVSAGELVNFFSPLVVVVFFFSDIGKKCQLYACSSGGLKNKSNILIESSIGDCSTHLESCLQGTPCYDLPANITRSPEIYVILGYLI